MQVNVQTPAVEIQAVSRLQNVSIAVGVKWVNTVRIKLQEPKFWCESVANDPRYESGISFHALVLPHMLGEPNQHTGIAVLNKFQRWWALIISKCIVDMYNWFLELGWQWSMLIKVSSQNRSMTLLHPSMLPSWQTDYHQTTKRSIVGVTNDILTVISLQHFAFFRRCHPLLHGNKSKWCSILQRFSNRV